MAPLRIPKRFTLIMTGYRYNPFYPTNAEQQQFVFNEDETKTMKPVEKNASTLASARFINMVYAGDPNLQQYKVKVERYLQDRRLMVICGNFTTFMGASKLKPGDLHDFYFCDKDKYGELLVWKVETTMAQPVTTTVQATLPRSPRAEAEGPPTNRQAKNKKKKDVSPKKYALGMKELPPMKQLIASACGKFSDVGGYVI